MASFGRCGSKTEWVYGFKVALAVTPTGVITAFGLAPANCDERPIGEALIAADWPISWCKQLCISRLRGRG